MLAIAEFERQNDIPRGYINFAIQASSPNGAWQLLERGEIALDDGFFAGFARDIGNPGHWRAFYEAKQAEAAVPPPPPPPPRVDGERLFWDMMEKGSQVDATMMGAVARLRAAGRDRGWKVGALTNDYKYPDGHALQRSKQELLAAFDVWIGSSECGMRKPEERVYRHAMREAGVVDGRSVVFCDDIGANLKAAARLGWRCVKVEIGGGENAVRELEGLTGVSLLPEPQDDEEGGTNSSSSSNSRSRL